MDVVAALIAVAMSWCIFGYFRGTRADLRRVSIVWPLVVGQAAAAIQCVVLWYAAGSDPELSVGEMVLLSEAMAGFLTLLVNFLLIERARR